MGAAASVLGLADAEVGLVAVSVWLAEGVRIVGRALVVPRLAG